MMAALFVEMGTLRKDLEDAHASCREASWARVDLQEQVRGLKVSQCQHRRQTHTYETPLSI